MPICVFEDFTALDGASHALQLTADCRPCLGFRRSRRQPQVAEERLEPRAIRTNAGQPMPGIQQVGRRFAQRLPLFAKHLQGEACIQFRIVDPPSFELRVLIVLDQVMVGVAGKSQRVQPQGIRPWQPQQTKIGVYSLEVGNVETDQIVTKQAVRTVREVIQRRQCFGQVAAAQSQGFAGVCAYGPKFVNAFVTLADFQIQRDAAIGERARCTVHALIGSPASCRL